MAIDNKQFFGGLNTDDDDNVIPNGDYRYALNIRNSKQDNASGGAIENPKGNSLVYYNLGTGSFKCVGGYDDKLNNKVYYFVWNDNTSHQILEYNVNNNQISQVLNGSALNFQEDIYIFEQNIAIIDGLMYWTDGYNPPRKINIESSKLLPNGGFNDIDISAVKPAPQFPPLTEFQTDSTISRNAVRGKLFQFRYLWVYNDNEQSALSPISKVALPVNEGQYRPDAYYPIEENNNIRVDIDLGSSEVKRVKILFRESNLGDFYVFKDIDKSLLTNTPTSYNFFNDEVYSAFDNNGNTGSRLFDWLPLKADSQALIDGNKITYGGITEGYDPVNLDIEIEPTYGTLPRTLPPDRANLITNQYTPTGQYGVNLTPSSSAQEFQNFFSVTSGYDSIAGNSWFFKWSKNSIPNFSGVSGYDFATILNMTRSTSGSGWQSGDANAIWVTDIHSLECLLKNDDFNNGTISEGVRVILSFTASWYNFETLSQNTRTFKFQEIAVQGDSAFSISNRLKNQINSLQYNDDNVNLSFACSVTGYSRAYGYDVNTVNGATYGNIINIQVKGTVPSVNVVGSLNLPIPCLYGSTSIDIQTYAAWTTVSKKTLKMGAKHGLGIVYYDFANRSGLTNVQNDKNFYVEFPTERGIGNNLITDVSGINLTINHKAPSWATAYQIVYTGNKSIEKIDVEGGYRGFVQLRLSGIQSASGINNALQASISALRNYSQSTAENISLSYGFTKGDRIRFLKDSNDDYFTSYEDVEILSWDEVNESIVFKKPQISLTGTPVVEIYSPKKTSATEIYYEVGEVYRCVNGMHYGDTNQTEDVNGNILTPATISLEDFGDVYLRYRTTPITTQVEDYSFSDFYDSDSWDRGRPNIVDNNIKQTYRPSTVRYSQSYVPETNINGLSRFDDFDFEVYSQKYGSIKLMHPENQGLNIFQQLKVGQVGVGQGVLYSNDGTQVGTVKSQTKVLSDIRYYSGEFGIGNNPESFAVYGNNKYFVDVKRGAVLRLGADGITPISNYKMYNYFTDTFALIDSGTYSVLGSYDVRFGTYMLHINGENFQDTLTYSEDDNRWVEHWSIYPDFMVSNRTGIIMFKNGELYTQNTNNLYNNFFGQQYHSELRFVSNVEPLKVKFYNNLIVNSNDVWEMTEAINNNDQKTSLLAADFEDIEGAYKASLLRDENTPNVSLPLIEGDEIRGEYLDITLKNTSTSFVKLKNVGIGLNLSELTGR